MDRQWWMHLRFLLALAAIGCTDREPVDLGNSRPAGAIGASLVDYAGSWVGYAEAYRWSDGSDRVRLRLNDQGQGSIEVGEVGAPAPVFDRGTFDMPGLDAFKGPSSGLVPGFTFTVSGASITSNRIQLGARGSEIFEDWCGDFEPLPDATNPGRFACAPNVGWSYELGMGCRLGDEARTPIACSKLYCSITCDCDADSCFARERVADIRLDAALAMEGEELTGTLVTNNERVIVRMLRAP